MKAHAFICYIHVALTIISHGQSIEFSAVVALGPKTLSAGFLDQQEEEEN